MYKKRIKDWAIDKNLKSDRPLTSTRTQQHREVTQNDPQSSVWGTVGDAQRTSNYVESYPDPAQNFQCGTLPSAEETTQREYYTPTTTLPPQQHNAGHYWASTSQPYPDGSYSSSPAQSFQLSEQARASALLGTVRDRFLEASDAITRRQTARLFEILNPAYEAMSNIAETEAAQLLATAVDLFELLYRRPNHQDMLRQLLQYLFALAPDAVRQNQFLSCDSQVLALLGRSSYDSAFSAPLDTAYVLESRPTASSQNHDYCEQRSEAGQAFDNSFGRGRRYPY